MLTGCVGPRVEGPVRAIWVTRFDYKTANDVTRIVDNCAEAGFNTILFQVRGNGTAFYKSSFEPWADELGGEDPGFDPLELACQRAHEHGVELHAYVNAMPAWRGVKPPSNPEQLYHKHPEWFWYDQNGERQKLSSFYVSLNPCLPEVREYIVDVFRDIVARYDVDGLHLDYIRFPNEAPATPRGSGLDYPRDERTLALYKADTGLTPDEDEAAWDKWREEQITQLVADIHSMIRWTRPRVVLSASVASARERAVARYHQDALAWVERGAIDMLVLMNYTDSPAEFEARNEPWLAADLPVPTVPGLWFGHHRGKSNAEIAEAVKSQVEIAAAQTGSFCVFAYSSLFDSDDEELTSQSTKARAKRKVMRDAVVPCVQALAADEAR
jgi:uncharacterized lipoprotein YddW (UPF0748 family)